jgi:hypothetical protein
MVITDENPLSHVSRFHKDYERSFTKDEPRPTKKMVLDEIGKILQEADEDETGFTLLGDYTEATANLIRVGRLALTQGFEGFRIKKGFRCTHCPRFGEASCNHIFVSEKKAKEHVKKCQSNDVVPVDEGASNDNGESTGVAPCHYQQLIQHLKMENYNSLFRIEVINSV